MNYKTVATDMLNRCIVNLEDLTAKDGEFIHANRKIGETVEQTLIRLSEIHPDFSGLDISDVLDRRAAIKFALQQNV